MGIGFSWALGSNSRFVHWLFVAFGLLLLIEPAWVGFSWLHQKPEFIKMQNDIIQTDRELIENQQTLVDETPPGIERAKTREGLGKATVDLFHDTRELRRLQSEGAFRFVTKNDWQPLAGGILLLCSGVGLLVGIKPRRAGLTPPQSNRGKIARKENAA
ncbi:MAG: hypothetical protein WA875_06035 [Candidatus Acidiferrales bacterium]